MKMCWILFLASSVSESKIIIYSVYLYVNAEINKLYALFISVSNKKAGLASLQ